MAQLLELSNLCETLQIFRQVSEPQKHSNTQIKVVLSYHLSCRKRRRNLQSFKTHLRNLFFFSSILCLTYVLDVFAPINCWVPRIFAQRFVLRTFFSKCHFFFRRKVCTINIFQFVYFRARARNGVSGLLLLCWKTTGKPYYWNKKSQELWWLWAFVLPERQLCQS